MSRPSFRVYVVRDQRGLFSVRPMARPVAFFTPPSAAGPSEEQALERLEIELAVLDRDSEEFGSMLWEEDFQMSSVLVEVRPETFVRKRRVIGKERVPLELTYAWSRLSSEQSDESSGYRVLLPRFDWSFTLEDLSIAPEVLRQSVSSALSGEKSRLLFAFREVVAEYVIDWAPKLLRRKTGRKAQEEDKKTGCAFRRAGFRSLLAVARESAQTVADRGRATGRRQNGLGT
jgi:ATP-dependent Clp protease ATP-binding subunit ClpC